MPNCFEKRFVARFNPLANPTYTRQGIRNVLKELFGDLKISDIRNHYRNLDLFVPALNLTQNRYKVFDNISNADMDVKVLDVAEFTSSAPSYYDGVTWNNDCMIDGGIIEVAPLLTTVTGLAGKRGISFSNMDVLMIGSGHRTDNRKMTTKEYNSLSLLGIATDLLAPYVTLSNSIATLYWGKNMGFNSFEYFNPVPVSGGMDDIGAMNEALEKCPDYFDSFLQTWVRWINA